MNDKDLKFADFDIDQLRAGNQESIFLNEWYDDAVIGIDKQSKSIVYSLDKLVELEISLRFEEGGLNPEYDEVDDDIQIVCQDSVFKLFQMIQDDEQGIQPTLFDENTGLIFDVDALTKSGNKINIVFGEEINRYTTNLDMQSKRFTYEQLSEIVGANESEYLRFIELQQFNSESLFKLVPRQLLTFEGDDEPIVRTVVKLFDEPYWLGFQDLTFDQWERR